MTGLCPDCRAATDRWVHDSGHLLRPPGIKLASNAAFDDTEAGVRQNRRDRVDAYYRLVRTQVAGIREVCAARHQLGAGLVVLPDGDEQLELFRTAS